ncbi:hypothetical protein HHX47_DHR5001092 [Lentinula edodes]|nr:hypothetical protein HHX47_DHR5001092 [Lentinula edodes]
MDEEADQDQGRGLRGANQMMNLHEGLRREIAIESGGTEIERGAIEAIEKEVAIGIVAGTATEMGTGPGEMVEEAEEVPDEAEVNAETKVHILFTTPVLILLEAKVTAGVEIGPWQKEWA